MVGVSDTSLARFRARAAPLRALVSQLTVGPTRRSFAVACRDALASLLEDLHDAGLAATFDALQRFDAVLHIAVTTAASHIEEGVAAEVRAAYAELSADLPAVFPTEASLMRAASEE